MRLMPIVALWLAAASVGKAGDLNIHVILSGEVAPGVYGQVQIGNEPPPPLVYSQPMLIEVQPAPPPAIYLHVPPGHARNWRKHCREYNACNRPVYFVRSDEYESDNVRRSAEREHSRRWDDDHQHGRDRERQDGGREGHDHHDD